MVKYITALFTFLTLTIACAQSIEPVYNSDYTELFNINNPLEITLTIDFDDFEVNKNEEEYLPAVVNYFLQDRSYIEKEVNVKARGVYRRRQCDIPPIRIHFNDKKYGIKEFNKFGKIKLVNTCKETCSYQQYLIKEFLVYKMYEVLTDYSFRSYFLKIKFVDAGYETNHFTTYGFLIEDIDKLAKRNDATEDETLELERNQLDTYMERFISVFQFMIGNTDWYVANLHNLKLIQLEDTVQDKPIPIPYDFDFSGFVNAEYAQPHSDLPIKTVRDRYFMGACGSKEDYQDIFNTFHDKKKAIYSLLGDCDVLDRLYKEDAISYLDEFYDIISDNKSAKREIVNKCR